MKSKTWQKSERKSTKNQQESAKIGKNWQKFGRNCIMKSTTSFKSVPQNKQVILLDFTWISRKSTPVFSAQMAQSLAKNAHCMLNNTHLIYKFLFQGSGNTWARYLIQQASGYATGCIYNDGALKKGNWLHKKCH